MPTPTQGLTAQLPSRALEGSELDPWEALISEQSPQALWLRSRLKRPWCWTLQENQRGERKSRTDRATKEKPKAGSQPG